MLRSIIYIFGLFLLAVGFTACYKDKGNYALHPINDITIKTISDTFRVNKFDTLQITPQIMQAAGSSDEGRLKFEWSVALSFNVPDTSEPSRKTIQVLSTQRNLNVRINLNAESSGAYNLAFKVTDTVTGVGYFKYLVLYVSSAFQTGWMLLEQKQGYADISMITAQDKPYLNLFSSANPGIQLPATSFRLASVKPSAGTLGALNFVLFDKEGYLLDKTSLKVRTTYSKFFYGTPPVLTPQEVVIPDGFASLYTFNAGKVYSLNAIYGATLFGAPFVQPDAEGSVLAPWAANGFAYGGIFFDQANYRFLYDGSTTTLSAFPTDNTMAFDLNNVHKTLLTMKPGLGSSAVPDNYYAVFRNLNDDSCFLYLLNTQNDPVAMSKQSIDKSPNVQRSVGYLFSPTVKQMYYAADNQVYVYDMVANQSRVVFSFAAGENVTAMQIRNGSLVVATWTGSAGSGSVYYLPISNTGDIQGGAYSKLFTGFGKIIHIIWKVG